LSPEGHRSSIRRLRATYRPSPHLRRRLVETVTEVRVSRDAPSEGPRHISRMRRRMARWTEAPLLDDFSSTPWSPVPSSQRDGDPFALLNRPRSSFPAPSREGKRSLEDQDAFCRQRPGARWLSIIHHHVARPQLAPRYAAPRFRGWTLQLRARAFSTSPCCQCLPLTV